MAETTSYMANPNLKRAGVKIEWTPEQIKEYVKCSEDPVYFALNYIRIVNVDQGLVPFKMWDFQKHMLETFHKNRFVVCKMPRQVGKCVDINTIVKIKDNITNEIFDMTIGDLYELVRKESIKNTRRTDRETESDIFEQNRKHRLRSMSVLCNEVERFDFTHNEYSQNKAKRVCEETSVEVSDISSRAIGEDKRKQKSSISTWGEVFSFFRKIYKGESQHRGIEENCKNKKTRNSLGHDEDRILVEENKWQFGRSERTSFEKTIHIFFREMHRKIWQGKGRESLEKTPRKVVKNIIQQIGRRDYENECFEIKKHRFNFEGRTRNFCKTQEIISDYAATICSFVRHKTSIFIRHVFTKFNNRISWRLLALQSEEILERLFQQKNKIVFAPAMGKRFEENFISCETGLYDKSCLGIGLQSKSAKSFTRVSDISKLSEITNRKFIESYEITRYSVFTDTGFEEIESLHKTIPYEKWKIVLNSGETLFCADDHILFDENFEEIYVKNCIPNITQIQTVNGVSLVKECVNLQIKENMFDLSLNSINKRFYTNNILSHNSTTIIAYLLHQILFRDNTSVAMLANKGATARELLGRLQLAYENLPIWLQQGIVTWNKGNIELENGSKVLAAATSSSAVRGGSFNILFLDEYAFVPNNQADQFFNSVYPTISSGKTSQVLVVSTPNGLNHFYRMWSDATNKRSNYVPVEVHWSQVPGRDEKWKEETIRNTSLEQFRVEFECLDGDTLIEIYDKKTKQTNEIKIKDLYDFLV